MIALLLIIIIAIIGTYIYGKYYSPKAKEFNTKFSYVGLPIVTFKSNGQEFNFLVDTGSNLSHLKVGVAEQMESTQIMKDTQQITTGNGDVKAHGYYNVTLKCGDKNIIQEFEIMDLEDTFANWGLPVHGILGVDFLCKNNYKLDFSTFRMYV